MFTRICALLRRKPIEPVLTTFPVKKPVKKKLVVKKVPAKKVAVKTKLVAKKVIAKKKK